MPSWLIRFCRIPSSSTPARVPLRVPAPPVRRVPPTTTAAIASSSQPAPATGCPAASWAREQRPREAGERPAGRVGDDLRPVHPDAHQAGRLLAAADGEDRLPVARPDQDQPAHDEGDEHEDYGRREAEDLPLPEPDERRVVGHADRLLVGEREGETADAEQAGQGHDKRGHPGPRDQESLPEAEQAARHDRQQQRQRPRDRQHERGQHPAKRERSTRRRGRCRR